MALVLKEGLRACPPRRRAEAAVALKCAPQHAPLIVDDLPKLDALRRDNGHGVELGARQQARLDQAIRADEQRIAYKGGKRLVGGIAVSGGAQGEALAEGS